MARLSLSFFGAFRVTLDGIALQGFRSNKVRALLAYLSIESARPHDRQRLAGFLWPDLPDQAAASAFRNTLSNLRSLLGDKPIATVKPFLLVTRESVQFNRWSDYWLDVQAFSDQLDAINTGPIANQDQRSTIRALQSAIALYLGDFLEGFFVTNSIPFDEWLILRSEAYHSQAIYALQQLGGMLIEQGEFLQAQPVARQQIELEPYSEVGYRQLMCSLAVVGQRAKALQCYDRLCLLLADELQASPEPETNQLYVTICSGEAPLHTLSSA
jgi:DNA-binding SARP family transcriptional activator